MLPNINENLIKQYLLEQAIADDTIHTLREHDVINEQYESYKTEKLDFDYAAFLKWLQEKQKNSREFGQFLLANGFLHTTDYATEITSDASLSCTQNILLPLRRNLVIMPAGEDMTPNYKVPTQRGLLVINGAYFNQRAYMMKTYYQNNFVTGFIESSNERYNEQLLEYYKRLQATLYVLRSFSASILEPKVKMIEKGKVHLLVRAKAKGQLKILERRVHSYEYDSNQTIVSNR